jgi:hypothetical protein
VKLSRLLILLCMIVSIYMNSAWADSTKTIQPITSKDTTAQFINGKIGSSPDWGSGWLNLTTPMDFKKGERLQLKIGGTADSILVRLLAKGMPTNLSGGLIGGTFSVPKNRTIEVLLDTDRRGIIQISVHGGPNPWDEYPLGENNGPATIKSAVLIRR